MLDLAFSSFDCNFQMKDSRFCSLCNKPDLSNLYKHLQDTHKLTSNLERKHWLRESKLYKNCDNVASWLNRLNRCYTKDQISTLFLNCPQYFVEYLRTQLGIHGPDIRRALICRFVPFLLEQKHHFSSKLKSKSDVQRYTKKSSFQRKNAVKVRRTVY